MQHLQRKLIGKVAPNNFDFSNKSQEAKDRDCDLDVHVKKPKKYGLGTVLVKIFYGFQKDGFISVLSPLE